MASAGYSSWNPALQSARSQSRSSPLACPGRGSLTVPYQVTEARECVDPATEGGQEPYSYRMPVGNEALARVLQEAFRTRPAQD